MENVKQIGLGEKVTFIATFQSNKYEKPDGWRIAGCTANYTPAHFPQREKESMVGKEYRFIARGKFHPTFKGEIFELTGEWMRDKRNSEMQFSVSIAVPSVPTKDDPKAVLQYIQDAGHGFGPKLAQAAFEWCDGDLLRIAASPRELAASIKGLSERKAQMLANKIDDASAMAMLVRLLNGNADPAVIKKLVNAYGHDAQDVLRNRPYDTASVIGFENADKIALKNDFKPRLPARIEAAALEALRIIKVKNGAIVAAKPAHKALMAQLLDMNVPRGTVTEELMDEAIVRLKAQKVIAGSTGFFYLYEDWKMECRLAQRIAQFGAAKKSDSEVARFSAAFDKWQEMHPDIKLHVRQSDAVHGAANLFSVVTGGPGTGKTTVLKAIMETYAIMWPNSPITLMAPTGLAAKRMSESCGRQARTIHKALGLIPAETASGFTAQDEAKALSGLIIVDECSMVGIHLANFLINAIKETPDTTIVFVGDVDQLPSVTPGNVLEDLIKCQAVHVTKLTQNFRQANGSNIADVAVKINAGNPGDIHYGGDCLVASKDSDEDIIDCIKREYQSSIAQYGFQQTYVVTPTHKSWTDPLSSNALNNTLQEMLNPHDPDKLEVVAKQRVFRVGDRVINKKNGEDVINGDIGYIREIVREDVGASIEIDFDGKVIVFPPERIKDLELAYAITVHSSQGCEFASVIMPVSKNHRSMLTRNLVYTAITRAKKRMLLVGTENRVSLSATTQKARPVSDLLKPRICKFASEMAQKAVA